MPQARKADDVRVSSLDSMDVPADQVDFIYERPVRPVLGGFRGRMMRRAATGFSFLCFGIGGLVMGLVLFPLTHLVIRNREQAQRKCRKMVSAGFRVFRKLMDMSGGLKSRWQDTDKLQQGGQIVIANHPTLVDVIMIVAEMEDAYCIVKAAAWRNPFLFGIMKFTGFIANSDGPGLIDDCVARLKAGGSIVIFPEGTRTVFGQDMTFERGFAIICLKSGCPLLPVFVFITPSSLKKGQPWYRVPAWQPLIEIFVGDPVRPADFGVDEGFTPTRARQLTRAVEDYYRSQLRELSRGQDDPC